MLTKNQLPTPALLVDLDALEANLTQMAEHVKQCGKKLRPHAKAHKCIEIAKRQIAAGATMTTAGEGRGAVFGTRSRARIWRAVGCSEGKVSSGHSN